MRRKEILVKASRKLSQHAEELRAAHTVNGKWFVGDEADATAQGDYAEMVELAAGLLAMARLA